MVGFSPSRRRYSSCRMAVREVIGVRMLNVVDATGVKDRFAQGLAWPRPGDVDRVALVLEGGTTEDEDAPGIPCTERRHSAGGGGTGGGACCAGALYCGCCCLDRTGGSFAKTPLSTARKSKSVDFCSIISCRARRWSIRPISSHSSFSTHIPVFCPLCQIRVVYSTVGAHMLSRSQDHVLGGCDVYDGWFSRV